MFQLYKGLLPTLNGYIVENGRPVFPRLEMVWFAVNAGECVYLFIYLMYLFIYLFNLFVLFI
jgi:hypothetical protein